mgnify:CR=1 FL=1
MERLTIKYDGLFTPKKACTIDRFGEADDCDSCDVICDSTHGSDCANCVIQECFTRLGEYEDTGFTPPEIMELAERDTAKLPIDIEDNYGFFVCPSCGNLIYASDDFESHKFCLNCGQRIQWRE